MPNPVVVDGATIQFAPGPGWEWVGWNGQVTLRVANAIANVSGRPVALETDLVALGLLLAGRAYKAIGFDDTAGAVCTAAVQVNAATLARASSLSGHPVATSLTSGTFNIACAPPSFKAATPPVPDPLCAMRIGQWHVVDAGQPFYQTD